MSNYEEAKEVAQKILELEKTRKTAQDEAKILKEELLAILEDSNIDSLFEFSDGIVTLERKVSYKIPDGLKEETELKSKHPQEISPEFLQENFVPDLKLSKLGKMRVKDESSELLSALIPEEKSKIKVTLSC